MLETALSVFIAVAVLVTATTICFAVLIIHTQSTLVAKLRADAFINAELSRRSPHNG